ncbi:16S rRNA (adenine(1518)-N(6)/adenine(1519)-N(6))-dimethyltransferase RsmA [Serpentinicella alkaliphila]|uniref:Ribosomal RNA small subunit methyltransferase A n=1 Tax=Serpentinicella alkaliphila TaxID=1734049 RepID=A0A4R2TE26_9FIRM|nr:16S rRNA (adenine(1518)-N(6)/adenine(1519)-N(6))-dimethyltransferase RsmA [Serpentinicella alkaliphila]QUH25095.1 16S rRNA (adenine(1518)-N(6)/adenine(1519)-N(6))-dimethyltransferase RsmA [Serpentinicella alkaliphila]TCQ01740.1 dimethyladenosine transferase [Serpentinicella alkaliphila]
MEHIYNINRTKEIVKEHGFKFSKSLGQNFLIDGNILNKIVDGAGITENDNVLEVGPGIGSLTQFLAERAKKVLAVEIDKSLLPILEKTLGSYDNVQVINKDILEVDLNSLIEEHFPNKKPKVVANLPYYVTTPIIMKFLEEKINIESLVVMIQKEVADRMQAAPNTKDYGALSIAVQYYCNPKILFKVPPSVFVPQPKVESTVIKLEVRETPLVVVHDERLFFNIIRDSFSKRRKTLLNALSTGNLKLNKELIRETLNYYNINENIRGEALSIEEFAQICNYIKGNLIKS